MKDTVLRPEDRAVQGVVVRGLTVQDIELLDAFEGFVSR